MASATAATLTPEAAPPSTGGNPYTGAGVCNIHFAAFLGGAVAFVLALVPACAVVYTVSYLVGRCHRGRVYNINANIVSDPENPAPPTPQPTTTLAGSAADCAICLAEFADGDAICVVPDCRHRFHASCIQLWLAGGRRSSCPTCGAPAVLPDEATDSLYRWLFIAIVSALQTAIGLAVFSTSCSSP